MKNTSNPCDVCSPSPGPGCPEKCRQGMEGEFPPWPWLGGRKKKMIVKVRKCWNWFVCWRCWSFIWNCFDVKVGWQDDSWGSIKREHLGTISSELGSLGQNSRNIRTPSLAGCSTGRHFRDSQDTTKITKQTHQASNIIKLYQGEEKKKRHTNLARRPAHPICPVLAGDDLKRKKLVVGGINTLDIVGNGSCKSLYAIRTCKVVNNMCVCVIYKRSNNNVCVVFKTVC